MEPAKGEHKEGGKEEPKKNAKQLRMEERAKKEAEKKTAKPAAAAAEAEADVDVSTVAANDTFGVKPLNQSAERPGRVYTRVEALTKADAGKTVLIRARLHTSRPQGKKLCFIVLRQKVHSVQAVASPESGLPLVAFAQKVTRESLVEVEGEVKALEKPVTGTTQSEVELAVKRFFVVSLAHSPLPLLVEDASRPQPLLDAQDREIEALEKEAAALTAALAAAKTDAEKEKLNKQLAEVAAKKGAALKFPNPDQSVRLNNRVIDLRTQANHGIFRIQSMVGQLFREFLISQHFVEIHSPKIISAASEGGANVFQVKYFDSMAYLAQSPQFYKQMAICADFERVFEIGQVFRAENANTHRHLTEFVGLDLEMTINEHYHEVLEVMDGMFCYIFDGITARCKAELDAVNAQYPFTPIKYSKPTLRLEFPEGVKMLRDMNRETLWLSVFLFVMCLAVASGMCVWLKEHEKQLDTLPYYRKVYSEKGTHPGKRYRYYGIPMETFFSFLSSVIVFQIMIPISLYITMELVRLGQSYFMIGDRHMYDDNSNSRFQCRSLNINEDLGQIRYIFSDKTGTLTENKMEFKRASVWGKNYGRAFSAAGASLDPDFGESTAVPSNQGKLRLNAEIPTDSELMELLHIELAGEERIAAHEFFMTLAACNTVIPILTHSSSSDEVHDTVGTIEYQGESPDEQALVAAASAYGYTLCERTSGHIVIDVNGEKLRLDVLGLHEFDSVRKRMSVVIRFPSGAVKVLVKGADTTMFSILRKDHKSHHDIQNVTLSHLNEYSSEGLRTLVVGARDLTGEELEEWQFMYEDASTSLTDRSAKLRQTASLIECNLTLLGASAIEDKLQEGVPEAIESLRQAGMKVWVLTGDKQETAISIGMSCKLLTSDMQRIIINGTSENECKRLLFDAKIKYGINSASCCNQISTCQSDAENSYLEASASMQTSNLPEPHAGEEGVSDGPLALIIDGNSLVYILEKDLETELFDLATSCRAVICCRVAPLQKAGIVDLIKSRTDDMTLAIGDGANDVSMIQMADVGVGLCGQEGRQAVMASDFAMGQFRFLKRLLLVHGHWNYQRVGYLVLYNFYRNAVFVFMLFWYILYAAFSTTSALTDWSSVFYSLIYTSIPTLVVGILDKDLSHKTLLKYPKLYAAGYRQESYNMKLFWVTMLDTVWQSLVLFYVPLFIYDQSDIDIWSMGSLWTIAVVILVNMHLAMDVQRWLIFTHMAIWGSIVITYGCLVVLDLIPVFPNYNTIFQLAKSPTYWLSILLIIVLALLPRFIVKVINQSFRPSDIQIAREAEILKKNHSYIMSRPDHDTS